MAKVELKDVRGLLDGDITLAPAALLKHVEKITLDPNGNAYIAAGNWNLLEQGARDGAGGPDRTVRLADCGLKRD